MNKLRDIYRSEACGEAFTLLRRARDLLVRAGAPRAADKVRRALKSADGAHRHAVLRRYR